MPDILAFDPGDTTGIAVFDIDGSVKEMLHKSLDDLLLWLANYEAPVQLVICEDFILFRKRAMQQSGSRMKASQAIGAIKAFALQKGATFELQKPEIKPIAMKWSQIAMPADHSKTHMYDAYLHGYYWLAKNGVIKTKLQEQNGVV